MFLRTSVCVVKPRCALSGKHIILTVLKIDETSDLFGMWKLLVYKTCHEGSRNGSLQLYDMCCIKRILISLFSV